jgi:diaminopimelate epimerase
MEFIKWHGLGNDFVLMELSPDAGTGYGKYG